MKSANNAPQVILSLTTITGVQRQAGVALIVVMMFIVILSSVAAFSARRALSGEGLSRNQLDVEIARQAAEAALRDAEFDLQMKASPPTALCKRGNARPLVTAGDDAGRFGANFFGSGCPQGQCASAVTANADNATKANAASKTNPQPWWPAAAVPTATDFKWNNSLTKADSSSSCTFLGAVPFGTFTAAPLITGVKRQPEYLIEHFRRDKENYFRITARGWGLSYNSEVVLQSFFVLANPQ
jgi:type IV pilus assembly protein PilX